MCGGEGASGRVVVAPTIRWGCSSRRRHNKQARVCVCVCVRFRAMILPPPAFPMPAHLGGGGEASPCLRGAGGGASLQHSE